MPAYKRKVKKGLRWRFIGSYLGVWYCSKAIYLTKKEALEFERAKIAEIDKNIRNPGNDIALSELFKHRLDYLELTRNREYFKDNRRLCRQIIEEWGDISASEVSKRMVVDLVLKEVRRCKSAGLGSSRPNQLLKVVKASFGYASRQLGLEIKNPCIGLESLPEDKKARFIPTDEMIEAVKAECTQDQRELIEFVYQTGARINEAVALDHKDVDEGHVVLYTRKTRNSARLPRFVPKPDFIKKGEGSVFKNWNAYPRFLERKVRELGQPQWNWHSLRHRRASIWAQSKPLFELQMLLGHTQISTTQRYLHSLGIIRL
jgi:integrase